MSSNGQGWLRYDSLVVNGRYYWFHEELKLLVLEPARPEPTRVYQLLDRIVDFRRNPTGISHPRRGVSQPQQWPKLHLHGLHETVKGWAALSNIDTGNLNQANPSNPSNPFNDVECEYLVEELKQGSEYAILKVDKRQRRAVTIEGYEKPQATNIDLDYTQGGEAHYWQHLFWFPFHHVNNENLRIAAINEHRSIILESLAWNNLKAKDRTCMSMAEIEENIAYFTYRSDMEATRHRLGLVLEDPTEGDTFSGLPVPANRIGSFNTKHLSLSPDQADFILAADALFNKAALRDPKPVREPWYYIVLTVLFLGMPPRHGVRIQRGLEEYNSTRHPESWKAFLNQLRQERDSMNIIAGLLLAGAVAFVAVPDVTGASRALAMTSSSSALVCITVGYNPAVSEWLFEGTKLGDMGVTKKLMKQMSRLGISLMLHFAMLWISIIALFGSFVAYAVNLKSLETASFTALVAMAVVAVVFIFLWNLQFQV